MAPAFTVNISTFDRTVYKGEAVSLIAPGECGYIGILAHHAPLITPLKTGDIKIRETGGGVVSFKTSGTGFLEVLKNNVTLLLDSVLEK